MKKLFLLSALMFPTIGFSSGLTLQCSGYKFEMIPDSMFKINGETVTSQKIKDLGTDGMKVEMGLMPARDGNNYGYEYIHRPDSDTRFLNVQLIQFSQDAPKIIGSFPCRKVKD